MRLIDADALNERMYHDAFEADSDMQKWDSGCWIRYKMFERAIEDAPTIKERKKGKWDVVDYNCPNTPNSYKLLTCSICGERQFTTNIPRFCQFCGSLMEDE